MQDDVGFWTFLGFLELFGSTTENRPRMQATNTLQPARADLLTITGED